MSRRQAKDTTKSLTVKQATFDLLRAFGIKKVFGNPGSTELPFLSDWPDDIDYVLGLQEASVVGMADGYAQATRNAGFVNLHSAAGVGNALGNIYTAHRNQTPLVITAGQQARSILPLQAFLYAERASEFPRPYVKYSVEPARAEDVPAAIARAYYTAMQPPCGPTFVSVPIDDWTHPTQAVEAARQVSREIGPDPERDEGAGRGACREQAPCPCRRPRRRSRRAVDLMVKVAEKAKAAVWVSPFSARCSFPERHPQFAGFLHASPAQLSDALRGYDLVVVIGAPVFTFHVEGHAVDLRRRDHDLPDHRRSRRGGGDARRHQHHRDHEARAHHAAGVAAGDKARRAGGPHACRPRPRRPIRFPWSILLHSLSAAMPDDAALVEEVPSHRPAMQKFMPMRGQDSFYTMASGGLGYSLPAAVGMALGRGERRTVCLIGDGSAMYSIQALWTAAQRKLPLTVVVINNSGYGAMRSFSQVMQVRNVPGLDLPGIDFVKIAEGIGCEAVRVTKASELARGAEAGAGA